MKKLLICLPLALLFIACEEKPKTQAVPSENKDTVAAVAVAEESLQKGVFTDSRDGKEYRTVKIGKQTWMAENLNYKTDSSWCYNNDESNCKTYGRLYNWDAAMKACPSGWHLPDTTEWKILFNAVGGKNVASKKLKSKNGWVGWKDDGGKNREGIDEYGFSAKPGGIRESDGSFNGSNYYSYWWSAAEYGANYATHWHARLGRDFACENLSDKRFGISVRCISDESVKTTEDKGVVAIENSLEPCGEDRRKALAEHRISIVEILFPFSYEVFNECDVNPAKKINNGWVSLYEDSEKNYYIKKADYYIGDGFNECTGDRTKDLSSKDDVVLFMNLPNIKKGKIEHIKIPQKQIFPNDTARFEFNGVSYYFRATGDNSDRGHVKDYKLYVGAEEKPEELLLDIKTFEDAFMKLIFIGDIDGDGIPDFIFDTSYHYEFKSVELFLSTMAEKGKITKKVAALGIGFGC